MNTNYLQMECSTQEQTNKWCKCCICADSHHSNLLREFSVLWGSCCLFGNCQQLFRPLSDFSHSFFSFLEFSLKRVAKHYFTSNLQKLTKMTIKMAGNKYIWAVQCKKSPYCENYQNWLFFTDYDILQFKSTEYKIGSDIKQIYWIIGG